MNTPTENEDLFWITFSDFRSEFSRATICYYNDDYHYESIKLKGSYSITKVTIPD